MPLYDLTCPECGAVLERYAPISVGKRSTGCECGGEARRVFTPVSTPKSFPEHFNPSVGEPVSSMRQFNDALRRKEEEQFRRTGIEGRFVALESGEAPGVEDTSLVEKKRHEREGSRRSHHY